MAEQPMRTADIAIVGGGIAGLAAAAALAGQGRSIVVIEARPLSTEFEVLGESACDYDSRVSALTPKSIQLLERLGVWSRIDAWRQCPYSHMTVWDAEGTGRIEFDAGEVGGDSLGSIVENRLITAALAATVESLSAVSVLCPARVTAVERDDSGATLTLDNGESLRCQLLIAADGALSPTRERLGLATREWDYGHRAIVTTVAFEQRHQFTAWQRFLQTGPLALLPLAGGDERRCSIVWSISESEAEALLACDDREFGIALAAATEHCLGAVLDCAPRQAFPLRQRHAVDYVLPGAVLVGDAAHSIHPLAGQGINLGLADVEVLAEELGRASELGLAPGRIEVLKRYQRRRKGDNLAMMAAMDGFKRLFAHEAPAVRWLRNTGITQVASTPALKRRIIRLAMGAV